MNIIWFLMIVLSILCAISTGKANIINTSILSSPAGAITFSLNIMGNICLWLGIMRIAQKAGLIEKVSRVIKPVIKRIFPEIPTKHGAFNAVTLSLVANLMGIGNAATAFGLKAMGELQKLNSEKDYASNTMCMFIIVNSFMIQLIHTNTLYLRNLAGSVYPALVMPAITISTFLVLIVGIMITRIYEHIWEKRL